MIAEDRRNGKEPLSVVGTAGTVNTGAFDDLKALGDISRMRRLGSMLTARFGISWMRLVPNLQHLTNGVEG